ncbi:hypothetical protein BGW42_007331, partial [Actinomortierella wolfii]
AVMVSNGPIVESKSPFVSTLSPSGHKRPWTPQGKVANKMARHEASKIKFKEPWHSLIEAALLQ